MTPARHAITTRSPSKVAAGIAAAIVLAVVLNAVISVIAQALGASSDFRPLQFGPLGSLTVIGALAGMVGWMAVRRFARSPARVLRWLVPTVLLLSIVPDLLLVFDDNPAASGLAIAALVVMHFAVAGVLVPVFNRLLPVGGKS